MEDADRRFVREVAEEFLRARDDLRLRGIRVEDSTSEDGVVSFRFHSDEGEHSVRIDRPRWYEASPREIADEASREAMTAFYRARLNRQQGR